MDGMEGEGVENEEEEGQLGQLQVCPEDEE